LINYFAEEMKTLPPAVAHKPVFEKVRAGVGEIRDVLNKAPEAPALDQVRLLHTKAKELNLAIAAAD